MLSLQKQIDATGEDVETVHHIRRNTGIQAVNILAVTLDDQRVLIGVNFLNDFQLFQLQQHVIEFAADQWRRTRRELFTREAQRNSLAAGFTHVIQVRMVVRSSRDTSSTPLALRV